MYYAEVFEALNREKVKYLVVGGVAVVLHSVMRLTADLDLMVDLKKENLLSFIKVLSSLGYMPKLPVEAIDFADPLKRKTWIKEKNMKVFSFIHSQQAYKIIDVFADEPISFADAYNRKQVVRAGELPIDVISLADLIILKKLSAREQDLADIKMLEALQDND
ncbi:hypothetical protein A3K48_00545 [candidate division WOR-1 bacterium RIFOXYA12_FULL_52_29]|uniref:DUF6036 domain-containing protein n=1 Tax=candidate division WOR-1 bacterium RIFOXYC12_FULL_54_18 TaxID=1802584 RepID=A0A1F4T3X7_UNCSA|nr:MAG: hypothetical protein A3K44_00545 [candidate division WOR-1 bacterium RIFOXYA2_FULL_51_19]OGC17088.1 MAG: hypothetical protein A3K48_00545 [candidate division WOR-1 bacterium RIFOXYA12_FULL_52_29]OGC25948.1 MAG: hypothetical protein A3K32_00540 [candidate division WOR-1 bacterium RIFOXYB2_FULL_45_9]OGC27505.1 MAG: hypothetical protein A3K49_00545 [candidate division WOR-1 bacterium RIFOXYC12_FULL_54_18]OGC29283.1 MAG: hypothetical protein A2346_01165 [candidate division WOR-1 bacterium R